MELVREMATTAMATLRDVMPIVLILVVFQFAVLRRRPPRLGGIAIGFLYMFIGLTLFLVGLEQALFPIGRTMARQLTAPEFITLASGETATRWWDYAWVYAFAFAVAFAATVAEPALIAVTLKAHQVSGGAIPVLGMRVMVALGLATGVAIGAFRIVTGTPLPFYVIAAFAVVIAQTLTAPRALVPLAYDSGVAATSTVTVPIVTALGLGLAAAIPGRDPLLDGFGLIVFACLFPIMSVLAYAWGAEHLPRAKRRAKREAPE
jgi:hypothetical protein